MTNSKPQFVDKENLEEVEFEDDYFDKQDLRVINILAPGKQRELEDVPSVNNETINCYCCYLKPKLKQKLLLTGREAMGYFSWEERFEWGYGSQAEYNKLRKINASYQDKYEFITLIHDTSSERIFAKISRISDKKKFDIALEDLQVCKQGGEVWQLLEDYAYWFENC